MDRTQVVYILIIISFLIINAPLIGYVRYLFIAERLKMVISDFQNVLNQLQALVDPVTALKAAADAGSGAVSAQDVADTVAALQTAVNNVASAAGVPAQ